MTAMNLTEAKIKDLPLGSGNTSGRAGPGPDGDLPQDDEDLLGPGRTCAGTGATCAPCGSKIDRVDRIGLREARQTGPGDHVDDYSLASTPPQVRERRASRSRPRSTRTSLSASCGRPRSEGYRYDLDRYLRPPPAAGGGRHLAPGLP